MAGKLCSNRNRGSGPELTSFCCQVDGTIGQGYARSSIFPRIKPLTFTISSLNIERVHYRPVLEKYAVHCSSSSADCMSLLSKADVEGSKFSKDYTKSLSMNSTGTSDQGVLFYGKEERKNNRPKC